ncbi:hypothetical protein CL655_00495 [bacterium]|nr:hypothetical protein [bacterium]|tara:strand:+ start:1400 stop:2437 length:1038 start_codon:yes stop_codon:yes gene_type:complete
MPELDTDKVFFPRGEQERFISRATRATGLSTAALADKLKISSRTLRDWRREKYRMNYGALSKLCKLAAIPHPKKLETKPQYHHLKVAGQKGGRATIKKYGGIKCDPEYRHSQWKKWWNQKGRHNLPPQSKPLKIRQPKHSPELAEFVGIMIGDGGMSKRQITITLNRVDDLEYAEIVATMCERLFSVKPSYYHRPDCNVVNIVISRSSLVIFCQSLGLVVGDKIRQNVRIPGWIRSNDKYLSRCLRGIFDTDGGIFFEKHVINNKSYSYPRIAFVSASPPLIQDIEHALKKFGYSPKIRNNKRVQLEKKDEIVHYSKSIGSSNPKHSKKFKKILEGCESGLSGLS